MSGADPTPRWTESAVAAALQRRPPGRDAGLTRTAGAAEAFAGQVDALLDTLDGLHDPDWLSPVAAYPWTVHDLAAHLLAVARYAGGLVTGDADPSLVGGHIEMSEAVVAAERVRNPAATLTDLRAALSDVVTVAVGLGTDRHDDVVEPHGLPMRLGDYLVALTFEMWTHGDDVRAASGRPLRVPPPEVLHTMADLSVTSLPLLALLLPGTPPPADVHVVLTGDGGGTWDVRLGDPSADPPHAELVADVVDYCRVVARRIDPGALDAGVDGDPSVIVSLLEAARAIAV